MRLIENDTPISSCIGTLCFNCKNQDALSLRHISKIVSYGRSNKKHLIAVQFLLKELRVKEKDYGVVAVFF